jgi:hypothetical protein
MAPVSRFGQCRAIVPNGSLGSFTTGLKAVVGLFWDFIGQSQVSRFFVLSPPRRTVLVLVLDFFHRLGSNVIFEVPESVGSRDIYRMGLGSAFSSTRTISLSKSTSTSSHF